MIVAALTGSIAMGKSETARMFASLGVPVFDSDAAVHRLYERGGDAVAPISVLFPDAIVDGAVDRARLAKIILNDKSAIMQLEAIVHPLVRRLQSAFIEKHRNAGDALIVLDIPLLFETRRDKEVDAVIVVSAPADIQRQRALERPGMTGEKFEALLARQMPNAEKCRRADFVIDSSKGLDYAAGQVKAAVAALRERARRN